MVAGYNEISVTELDENFNAIGSSKRIINKPNSGLAVSYTHLDVYKRQTLVRMATKNFLIMRAVLLYIILISISNVL